MQSRLRFQSLIGLKINWNTGRLNTNLVRCLFQSLIGLKINWNYQIKGFDLSYDGFQSLIGLKINWNLTRLRGVPSLLVSIPNRA